MNQLSRADSAQVQEAVRSGDLHAIPKAEHRTEPRPEFRAVERRLLTMMRVARLDLGYGYTRAEIARELRFTEAAVRYWQRRVTEIRRR